MINADVIDNLPAPKIMVIGDFLLDRYVWGKVERISPEAPIQILKVQNDGDDRLGGAANVVHNLITLGAKVIALGVIGTDNGGQRIISLLKSLNGKNRLNYNGVIKDKFHITSIKERMIAHNQQVLRVDREEPNEDYFISHSIERKLLHHFSRTIRSVDAVIISDYDKGTLTKTFLKKIIQLCRKYHKTVLVGPKGRDFTKYRGATAVVPNRSETEEATGLEITSKASSYKSAAQKMLRNLALDFTVITLGPDGLYLLDKKGSSAYDPARHRDVYDVTGAGDTVLAALGIAFAAKLPYQDALHLANLAAGVVVSKVGTATVSRIDIIQHHYLKSQHENIKAEHKLKTVKELAVILSAKKAAGGKVVFTNGCFDLIHPGHIRTLEFSRAQGDILMVGLNSDKSVRIIKGKSRPILNQSDRIKVLSAFSAVDYIVLFDQSTPLELIKELRPDVLVKGADWEEGKIVGADVVRSYGGRIARVPLIPGISTSDIIKKINKFK
ncbi:MAG: D-glycero-beta-D-manno-heptose 1-phosphate adenylyltransferase [Planctomycetes bacterium]|nr:D-glycero-beta-D-manno-heptose 1-phosphate adenylyltransferase [Planctomycetota bacterium]